MITLYVDDGLVAASDKELADSFLEDLTKVLNITTKRRSTSGVVCCYGGGIVSWLSHRQISVAICTTEAEIIAASEVSKELIWLKRIYADLADCSEVPNLRVDNEAAVRLAHNPEFHHRTKHIRLRHFFVREVVMNGDIVVERIGTCS